MPPRIKNPDTSPETYVGTIGSIPCHVCKIRGNGLTDADSNWRLWNADMKVYRDGAGKGEEDEVWDSIDEEILCKMERRRKAIIWFSISEKLREEHLQDMGGREKTGEDVMRRMFERVAPAGSKYEPLEGFTVTEEMRESVRRARERKEKEKREKSGKTETAT
jgi:hypothetical protein